jgi:lipopolysaccharide biosynthesis glycosyltransferase
MQPKRGIYFLADDGVYEWAKAFLKSLRTFNPDVLVSCIPFSDNIRQLEKLRKEHKFEIWQDDTLSTLDELGRDLMHEDSKPWLAHTFRKFAVFWSMFDEFLYLDSDIVVLSDLNQVLKLLANSDYDVLYAHRSLDKVYKPGCWRDEMIKKYECQAINAGVWASRKGLLSMDEIKNFAGIAKPLVHNFARSMEQPFMNFCFDLKRLRVHKISDIYQGSIARWAGNDFLEIKLRSDKTIQAIANQKPIMLIHWAGYNLSADMPYADIYRHFNSQSKL